MEKRVFVGAESFEELITHHGYYVDKTELIYELVEKSASKVSLFTRPRRFGKTLTLSMLESFFDIQRNSEKVFRGLKIQTHPGICADYMNRYPVLFLSFKDVEGLDFSDAFSMLKKTLSRKCIQLNALMQNDRITDQDRKAFQTLLDESGTISDIKSSLDTIMRIMQTVFGQPVILLIDEYDVPLAKANSYGYYQEMLNVIRGIMSTSLKTNEYLKFAVVTGCLRIPKESIFTGVNNFASYSVLDDRFSWAFGFSEKEVGEMLDSFGLADRLAVIREWYDGYQFGTQEIYCPWDVVNYISELLFKRSAKPRNYWENTSGNEAIKAFFHLKNTDVSDRLETLLRGGMIEETVKMALTYDEAYQSEANLWSILLMTGYVTTVHRNENDEEGDTKTVRLRIPNKEIAGIFQTAVVDHFQRALDQTQVECLMESLWNGDAVQASRIMSQLLWQTISYHDYHEDYYHAFLTGIFVGRGGYAVNSNKEQGLGRPDIDLRDRKNRRAMIMEAKRADSKAGMESQCNAALEQIVKNEYAKSLNEYDQVLCYGVSFWKKEAMIKRLQEDFRMNDAHCGAD